MTPKKQTKQNLFWNAGIELTFLHLQLKTKWKESAAAEPELRLFITETQSTLIDNELSSSEGRKLFRGPIIVLHHGALMEPV